jgi:hypothetical protein
MKVFAAAGDSAASRSLSQASCAARARLCRLDGLHLRPLFDVVGPTGDERLAGGESLDDLGLGARIAPGRDELQVHDAARLAPPPRRCTVDGVQA